MITPEKNDVDVSKLFHWGDKFTIFLPNNTSLDIYMRVVSDEELNKARVYALRKANTLKEKIYKKGSDERRAYLPNINAMKKEEIISIILAYELPNLRSKADRDLVVPFPLEPDENASTIEWVEYQKEVDEYPEKYARELNKKLHQIIREREKELKTATKEILKNILENRVVERFVTKELEDRFMDACVSFGAYLDSEYTKPVFKSPEEVTKLPEKIREQFISSYMSIDIPMDELKK